MGIAIHGCLRHDESIQWKDTSCLLYFYSDALLSSGTIWNRIDFSLTTPRSIMTEYLYLSPNIMTREAYCTWRLLYLFSSSKTWSTEAHSLSILSKIFPLNVSPVITPVYSLFGTDPISKHKPWSLTPPNGSFWPGNISKPRRIRPYPPCSGGQNQIYDSVEIQSSLFPNRTCSLVAL